MTAITASPVSVDFHGTTIPTFNVEGVIRVAMKPICDAIGLGWQSQWHRIKRHPVLSTCVVMMTTQPLGEKQRRKLLTLPLNKLNGWLFGIDAKRVKPEVREKLIEYQAECFDVLADYWQKGQPTNPRTTPDERAGLRAAVTMLTTLRGLMHGEAYRLVHQRYGVAHIDELSTEQLPQAVEYVHRLALDGEYMPAPEATPAPTGTTLTDGQLYDVWFVMTRLEVLYDVFKQYELLQVFRLLGSRAGAQMIDHFRDGHAVAHRLHGYLDDEFDAVQRRMRINQYAGPDAGPTA